TLRRMGERGDIIKALHRDLEAAGLTRAPTDYAIYDPRDPATGALVGRLVRRALSDELNDRQYVIVDSVDGRSHYVAIGKGGLTAPVPDGAIIAITPQDVASRLVDKTVAEIAAANGGRYDAEIHLRHDRTATYDYAETHVRRLEAMRRAGGL